MTVKKRRATPSHLGRRRTSARAKDNAAYAARGEEIIAFAADAFREEGYDKTALSDIAKRAGTDRASVYYYVSSKEELFQEVCSGMLEANLAAAEEIAARDVDAGKKAGADHHPAHGHARAGLSTVVGVGPGNAPDHRRRHHMVA